MAFWLVATDRDGDQLTYGISGLNAYYFSVNSNTGEVKLISSLDAEVKDGGVGNAWGEGTARGGPWSQSSWGVVGITHRTGFFSLLLQTVPSFKITISANDGRIQVSERSEGGWSGVGQEVKRGRVVRRGAKGATCPPLVMCLFQASREEYPRC